MVWKEGDNEPYISVYATNELSTDLKSSHKMASRALDLGLIKVEAQMLEPLTFSDPVEVLIAEVSESGRARVLLWDATNDSLKIEVNISLNPTRGLTNNLPDPSSSAEWKEPDRGHLYGFLIRGRARDVGCVCVGSASQMTKNGWESSLKLFKLVRCFRLSVKR